MRALALLLALGLLAGCVGKEADAGPVSGALSQLAGPSEEELARTPGSLQGIVHTPALTPIFGARVADPRLGLAATTDTAGFFRLDGLATGEHLLVVTAEGYLTRSVLVQARNGTTLELNVSLEPAPRLEPYVETRELHGFLACALLVADDARDCASADPNHRDVFELDLGAGAKGVVLELAWDEASTPAARSMALLAETVGYGAQDVALGSAAGRGYARVEVPVAVLEKYYPEGGVMRALVALAEGDAPASAALQARFVVYVSAFYHQAAPAGFSVIRTA